VTLTALSLSEAGNSWPSFGLSGGRGLCICSVCRTTEFGIYPANVTDIINRPRGWRFIHSGCAELYCVDVRRRAVQYRNATHRATYVSHTP